VPPANAVTNAHKTSASNFQALFALMLHIMLPPELALPELITNSSLVILDTSDSKPMLKPETSTFSKSGPTHQPTQVLISQSKSLTLMPPHKEPD